MVPGRPDAGICSIVTGRNVAQLEGSGTTHARIGAKVLRGRGRWARVCGVTVNRWLSTGFLGGSSCSNEAGYLTYKVVRSTGILALENQARI